MGDFVVIKRLIMEIIRLAPECLIDIYIVLSRQRYVRLLYADIKNINSYQDNLGTRYNAYKDKYALAMTIHGTGYLQVDMFQENLFGGNISFAEKLKSYLVRVSWKALIQWFLV